MQNEKNQNPDQKQKQGAQAGKLRGKQQDNRPKLTREQFMERKLEDAKKDDTTVVPSRSLETEAMLALMRKNDHLVNQLHRRVISDKRIDPLKAIDVLKRNIELQDTVNELNAELCVVLNLEYKPPRGFENPLKKTTGKKAADKETAETVDEQLAANS